MNQTKKQFREETEKAVAEFLKRGGNVQVVEARKSKKSGQNWKK